MQYGRLSLKMQSLLQKGIKFIRLIKNQIDTRKTNEYKSRRTKFAIAYEQNEIKDNVIFYEAYMGRGMLCNPYTIFCFLIERKEGEHYEHVWSIEDFEDNKAILSEYEQYSNVRFVKRESDEYIEALTTAKYLINNSTFPTYFTKKEAQIYINTWHGIPLKTLGYDLPKGNIEVSNTLRNFMMTDYLLSSSSFLTDIYRISYKLDGIYEGTIIEEGYPRNDIFYHYKKQNILTKMKHCGVNIKDNRKIILYAPTWKGKDFGNPELDLDEYFRFIREVEEKVDTTKYQVLVKPHQVVYQAIKDSEQVTHQFIPAILDTNEVLSVVDILVSDYSSIFFDYLVSGRPVLFYVPDLNEYKEYRGIYFETDQLPGPASKDLAEVTTWINEIEEVQKTYCSQYEKIKQQYCSYDNGSVTKRVCDIIFMNKKKKEYHVISDFSNEKKKVFLYVSDLRQNGITQSFLSLLNLIDYEKFDITVMIMNSRLEDRIERALTLNKNVRVLYRNSTYNASLKEDIRKEIVLKIGIKGIIGKALMPKKMFDREYRRCFGECTFDYAIDFTGYSSFFAMFLLHFKGGKKYIWLHNDLKSDCYRTVNGKRTLERTLKVVFSTYPYFDKLVACSKAVMELNQKSLGSMKINHKFTYVRNSLSYNRILESMEKAEFIKMNGEEYYCKKEVSAEGQCIEKTLIPAPKKEEINFVTMARLSPEKNQENLIRAFAKLHEREKNTKLFILGDGPLKEDLEAIIRECKVEGSVILTGNLTYPFPLIKKCNCFILPSNYEGQPMVLLEARVLEIPMVISNFYTAKDSFIENGQYVIKTTVDGIYKGMVAFIEGNVPNYHFEPLKYNQEVYKEFERLFHN